MNEKLTVDDMIELAFLLAVRVHKGQVDLSGKPYLYHVFYVATHIVRAKAMVVALLHDVIEDSQELEEPVTLETLTEMGFDEEVVAAVDAVSRRKGESYKVFIERVKENDLATEVKITDLKHNTQVKRLQNPTKKDLRMVEKYEKALETLKKHNKDNRIRYISDF
jgi:GTP diphosphokinase / guanosine-3',5'-bis(diphosphate) 3'-diphosphatase